MASERVPRSFYMDSTKISSGFYVHPRAAHTASRKTRRDFNVASADTSKSERDEPDFALSCAALATHGLSPPLPL